MHGVWSVNLGWSAPRQQLCQQVEEDKESYVHLPHNWASSVVPM